MSALVKANSRLKGHTELKRSINSTRMSVEQAMSDERAVGAITLGQLLSAQKGWGPTRMRDFLARLGAPPTVEVKRVELMTDRQKTKVAEALKSEELKNGWR